MLNCIALGQRNFDNQISFQYKKTFNKSEFPIEFPAIPQEQIQLEKLKIDNVDLNNASLDNLYQFVQRQKIISECVLEFSEMDYSVYTPLITHLLNLESLRSVKIRLDNIETSLPVDQINNHHVKFLRVDDHRAITYSHCFRLFPAVTKLEIMPWWWDEHVVEAINSGGGEIVTELTVNGRYAEIFLAWNENFLKELKFKILEKVSFREYPANDGSGSLFENRVEYFREFVKNHPNLKEFKVQTRDFRLETVEVILANLSQLEKLVIATNSFTFAWNQSDLEKLRLNKGVKLFKIL